MLNSARSKARTIGPVRGTILLLLVALALVAVPLAAASSRSAHPSKPKIKTTEVGYFGNALVTNEVVVIVYSNVGPRAGNHVTVCLKGGKCKKAQGHNAHLAWYAAEFNTGTHHMGDPVTFTATAADRAGRTKITATKPVLCIKNDGSTPQS